MIPFLELKLGYLELKDEFDAAYHRVMNSGWYLMGGELEAFEVEFAKYVGADHCVAVGTGLDALVIALKAHGIGPGDEVIVPAHTFIATWLAVTQSGGTPVPVDVREDSGNIDPSLITAAITERTKAIIPVHLYGLSADMDAIMEIAKTHDLVVIEDAAQAHGAAYKGRNCGTLGHSAAFSFYPGKNLGAFSDGGAITTNDPAVALRAQMLRNYGSVKRYHHDLPGTNSRLDEIQAAFLRIKLQKLDEWNSRRRNLAVLYQNQLSTTGSGLALPVVPEWADPVWHLFAIRHLERDSLQNLLEKSKVQTIIHYPIPPHRSGAYTSYHQQNFPVAEAWANTVLSLPIGPHMSENSVLECAQHVQDAVRLIESRSP